VTLTLGTPCVVQSMLELTDAVTNELLEPVTFVPAYRTVLTFTLD